jgi:hypothetical protein
MMGGRNCHLYAAASWMRHRRRSLCWLHYFEYPSGALYLELPDDVARYRLMFDHLRAMALSPEDSRRLLARSAEDLA